MAGMNTKRKHRFRHSLAEANGWLCSYCGAEIECPVCNPGTDKPATLDHVIARTLGGANTRRNLCLACKPCNEAKSDAETLARRVTHWPTIGGVA